MSVISFFKNIRRELFENTTWPTRDIILEYTVWVVISLFFAALFLFGIDYFSSSLVNYLFVEKVSFFRDWLEWTLQFRFGLPYRFIFFVFFVTSTFIFFKKIFSGEAL